jgi:hypothetical protein
MSTVVWLARALTGRDRQAAFVLVSVVLIAVALLLAIQTRGNLSASGSNAPRVSTSAGHAASRGTDLEPARLLARRFLRGYLAFVYGHEPASAVSEAAPSVVAALSNHQLVPSALARLHPRIVALNAAPTGDGAAVAVTATIRDGEVLTYPIRLLIARSRDGRLLVAKVGEG